MSEIHLTDSEFQKEVKDYKGLVLVDFWAPWCGPCRIVGPVIEELAEELKEKVKVCKMNVDENMQVPQEFGIMSIPTIMLFKDGEVVETLIGVQSKDVLTELVEKNS